jgi:hypothetical protein
MADEVSTMLEGFLVAGPDTAQEHAEESADGEL